MTINEKFLFGQLKKGGKRKKKNKKRRSQDRNEKRETLDLLMELNLHPTPQKRGWISFDCPFCKTDHAAVINCVVGEFHCGHCRETGTIPYLLFAGKNNRTN